MRISMKFYFILNNHNRWLIIAKLPIPWETFQLISNRLEYFSFWNENQCSELANVQTYKPFDIVYVPDRGRISKVHIIISGRCSIIQYLNMNVRHENGCEQVLSLQSPKNMASAVDIIQEICTKNDNEAEQLKDDTMYLNDNGSFDGYQMSKNANIEMCRPNTRSHFVEIGEYGCGSMFGLGEHMDDRAIVAKQTDVQCLLIPHYWLLEKKQNAGNICQRTKLYLDFTLPSRQEVFDDYFIARKWKKHKNKVILNSQSRRPSISSTKVEDIPIVCRLNNAF